MFVTCNVPAGTVFSRQLPTKGNLLKSDRVKGAFVHSFALRNGTLSVPIVFHVKAGSLKELRRGQKWNFKRLEEVTNGLEFVLSPAPKKERVTACALLLESATADSATVRLANPEMANKRSRDESIRGSLFMRRGLRASLAAGA